MNEWNPGIFVDRRIFPPAVCDRDSRTTMNQEMFQCSPIIRMSDACPRTETQDVTIINEIVESESTPSPTFTL
jgi:hypothetical protein